MHDDKWCQCLVKTNSIAISSDLETFWQTWAYDHHKCVSK